MRWVRAAVGTHCESDSDVGLHEQRVPVSPWTKVHVHMWRNAVLGVGVAIGTGRGSGSTESRQFQAVSGAPERMVRVCVRKNLHPHYRSREECHTVFWDVTENCVFWWGTPGLA